MTELGLYPILFEIGDYKVMSYHVCMVLAITVGLLLFKRDSEQNPHTVGIVFAGLLGGALGAKLAMLIVYFKELQAFGDFSSLLLSGKSIVGGLIGGFLGVLVYKKLFKIKVRLGNRMVVPILVAMAIGRVGCLLNGCCYGKVTHFPVAMKLGDGQYRHPTQIYEIIFDLSLAWYLNKQHHKMPPLAPGKLYQIFISAYLLFRFFLEFIRDEKVMGYHLTYFQVICLLGIIFVNWMRRKDRKLYEG